MAQFDISSAQQLSLIEFRGNNSSYSVVNECLLAAKHDLIRLEVEEVIWGFKSHSSHWLKIIETEIKDRQLVHVGPESTYICCMLLMCFLYISYTLIL